MLTKDIKQSIDECVLCWLATADEKGSPNCSPKEIFSYFGDSQVVIANIASPGSVSNIAVNPLVCVSFVHVFKQKGFKLKGNARYALATGSADREQIDLLQMLAGESFPVRGAVIVDIVSVEKVVAPGYILVPGTTEQKQIENAKQTYGV